MAQKEVGQDTPPQTPPTDNKAEIAKKDSKDESASEPASEFVPDIVRIIVKLPTGKLVNLAVSLKETFADIRQSLLDVPSVSGFTCFGLYFKNEPVADIIELSDIPEFKEAALSQPSLDDTKKKSLKDLKHLEIELREEPYTEAEARKHIQKAREIASLSAPLTKFYPGDALLDGAYAGSSLLESVQKLAKSATHKTVTDSKNNNNKKNDKNNKNSNNQDDNDVTQDYIDNPFSNEMFNNFVEHAHNEKFNLLPLISYKDPATNSVFTPKTLVSDYCKPALKSLYLSSWNPPSPRHRLLGHLLYLQATTLEGELVHITSTFTGFYVSNSTNQKFDMSEKQSIKIKGKDNEVILVENLRTHSLIDLLRKISPLFALTVEQNVRALANIQPLVIYPPTNYRRATPYFAPQFSLSSDYSDLMRTQELYLEGGSQNPLNMRDWNEDLQATKEMPKESIPDRILRERMLNKLYFDFTENAARGAVLIARGEIAPLNPLEPYKSQIFLHNGIFFSYGADGIGTFLELGEDDAARVAVGKDLNAVRLLNAMDIPGLHTLATTIIDYCGNRIVAQSPVPGVFRQRDDGSSQIVYGGIEGREVIADNKRFHEKFSELARYLHLKPHKVWDADGKAHELYTSVETKGLEGTDGRDYVLDLYRITPVDVGFLDEHVENASDRYPHNLTLLRFELVENWWKSQVRKHVSENVPKTEDEGKSKVSNELENDEGKEKETETETEREKKVDTKEAKKAESKDGQTSGEKSSNEKSESANNSSIPPLPPYAFSFNPDAYTKLHPSTPADKEAYDEDVSDARKLSKFLTETIIPEFIQDSKNGTVPAPIDGSHLTKILHYRGINMRYLGKIATACKNEILSGAVSLKVLHAVTIREIIVRSAKHILNKLLFKLDISLAPYAISHFFNCLLGFELNSSPDVSPLEEELKQLYSISTKFKDSVEIIKSISPESVHKLLLSDAKACFRYNLGASDVDNKVATEWVNELKKNFIWDCKIILRELCEKFGVQLVDRVYAFSSVETVEYSTESENSKSISEDSNTDVKKKKKSKSKKKSLSTKDSTSASNDSGAIAHSLGITFVANDIISILPVIKQCTPNSQIAEDALEAGRIALSQGNTDAGFELLLESISLHEQIYGILHPEVASAYSRIASVYNAVDQKDLALELARKAVIISERVSGIDTPDTVLYYMNLILLEYANKNYAEALYVGLHSVKLMSRIFGLYHPDMVIVLTNIGLLSQILKQWDISRKVLEWALHILTQIQGPNSLHIAHMYFQIAQAIVGGTHEKSADKVDITTAINHLRQAHSIYTQQKGPDDKFTKEVSVWLEQLTQSAVAIARANAIGKNGINNHPQLLKSQFVNSKHSGASSALSSRSDLSEVESAVSGRSNLGNRPIDELVNFINGTSSSSSTQERRRSKKSGKKHNAKS